MAKLKVTKRAFSAWLQEHSDLQFTRNDTCDCPLAIFLGAGCDRNVEVERDFSVIDGEVFDNPEWARTFTRRVDEQEGKISASTALSMLTD